MTEKRKTGSESKVRIDYFYSPVKPTVAKALYLPTVSGQEMAFDSCRHLATVGLHLICPTYRGFDRRPVLFIQSRRKLQQDAQVAIEAALEFEPGLPLIIIGHSLGAYPAMFLTSNNATGIVGTILLAPLPNSELVVDYHLKGLGPIKYLKELAFFRFDMDTTFWASRAKARTALVYPTRDRLVPSKLQTKLLSSVPEEFRKASYPIRGAGHLPLIGESNTMEALSRAIKEMLR